MFHLCDSIDTQFTMMPRSLNYTLIKKTQIVNKIPYSGSKHKHISKIPTLNNDLYIIPQFIQNVGVQKQIEDNVRC